MEDYVERETAVASKRVLNIETAIMQELKGTTTAESVRMTTRKPETMFQEMLNAIADSLSDLAISHDEQDGEDEEDVDDETELGTWSDDAEPCCVMCWISKMVQHRIVSFWQKLMRLDELTLPGCGDTANYFCEGDMKAGSAK